MNGSVVIGLSAVVVAIRGTEAVVLTVGGAARAGPALCGLPSGPFDPDGYRTFELALRAFVADQTGFRLGWVEQLYTFGDKGRDAPLADVGAGAARVVSVGYLALSREAQDPSSPDTDWTPWTRFFPWEDWRSGRPAVVEREIEPALRDWAGEDAVRLERARSLFALDGRPWNEERVLERYELLYEAGLAPEARRDRGESEGVGETFDRRFGEPMRSDHRRILATGLGRLRGKLKYRPVVFELTPPEFTLSTLQRVVEAIAGLRLHKQNFRRGVARSGLATPVGRMELDTGGRPAALHRFAKERFAASPALGLPVPAAR